MTEDRIIFATPCTPQPLWGLRWKGVGSSGAQQIPFKLNRHTPTPLSGCRVLAGVLGSSGRIPPVREASGVLVVLSLPVPQVEPKATLPGQLRLVPAELGLDSERPDVVRGWPGYIPASSIQSSALRPTGNGGAHHTP